MTCWTTHTVAAALSCALLLGGCAAAPAAPAARAAGTQPSVAGAAAQTPDGYCGTGRTAAPHGVAQRGQPC